MNYSCETSVLHICSRIGCILIYIALYLHYSKDDTNPTWIAQTMCQIFANFRSLLICFQFYVRLTWNQFIEDMFSFREAVVSKLLHL